MPEQRNPQDREAGTPGASSRHAGPPLVIHCRVFHELAGDRIEIHAGCDVKSLRMAGVLWVAHSDTPEVVRRLQDPGTEAEEMTPRVDGDRAVISTPDTSFTGPAEPVHDRTREP